MLERLAGGRLVEGPEYASEDYVKGLARTLIVSGDTELISAPAYLKAAAHAPRLQSFVSVVGTRGQSTQTAEANDDAALLIVPMD